MRGTGIIKGLGITLRHWFEKDITIQYPEEPAQLFPGFRGCLVFEFEKCIACGLCMKACPNRVLSFETEKDEETGKKKLMQYTIDLQYCMFCNFCVEVCPKDCLGFSHDFELAKYSRDDIRIVYDRPADLDERLAAEAAKQAATKAEAGDGDEGDGKKAKQIDAMAKALVKSPNKMLTKLLGSEEEAEAAVKLFQADAEKMQKVATLLVEDKESVPGTVREYLAGAEKGGES